MRKTVCIAAGMALLLAGLSTPAVAKKKKKPKPIPMVYYMHGTAPVGEAELPETAFNDNWMHMDASEPDAGQAKSMNVTNYVGGPRTTCSGNGLLPIWVGALTGRVVGDMKMTLHTVALPESAMTAVIYPDPSGGCDEEAAPAAAQAVVVPAAGEATTEIVFPDVRFDVVGRFIVQFHIGNLSPGQVRLFYDSADAASELAFNCIPAVGTSCDSS